MIVVLLGALFLISCISANDVHQMAQKSDEKFFSLECIELSISIIAECKSGDCPKSVPLSNRCCELNRDFDLKCFTQIFGGLTKRKEGENCPNGNYTAALEQCPFKKLTANCTTAITTTSFFTCGLCVAKNDPTCCGAIRNTLTTCGEAKDVSLAVINSFLSQSSSCPVPCEGFRNCSKAICGIDVTASSATSSAWTVTLSVSALFFSFIMNYLF
eukprot:c2086_g1_i1.p1 GENE.c2086_g1_i1~~c2086_g1_i1.p1  ORF type:complete len:223 (+),score=56.33 c2086_g1_i1:27-671(+)